MAFYTHDESGAPQRYFDKNRYVWPLALLFPLLTMTTVWVYFASGSNALTLLLPMIYGFACIPLLDMIVPADAQNPPEDVTAQMSQDKAYDYMAYSLIPVSFSLFIACAWLIGTQDIPIWAMLALAIGVGTINGGMITIGHELGHRMDKRNRRMAKLALSLSGYGHFTIEHNRGHHVMVSTPQDCASSRLGESVYSFALRELPGTFKGGWQQEIARLKKRGLPVWHWQNEILQVYALWAIVTLALTAWLGLGALPFILLHHGVSWYALTQVNYVEHYGLLRSKNARGKYEPCQPRHSWNSNHRVSNIVSLHLQRHSDHHANPMRPYQALRSFDDVPTLPSGYPGCLVLAAIPPLWYKAMDKRVLEWADGDTSKANVCPKSKYAAQNS